MNLKKELHLQASEDTLYPMLNILKECLEQAACPEDESTAILIAAEEVYVNIAHYAYDGEPGEAVVSIEMKEEGGWLSVSLPSGIGESPMIRWQKKTPILLCLKKKEKSGVWEFIWLSKPWTGWNTNTGMDITFCCWKSISETKEPRGTPDTGWSSSLYDLQIGSGSILLPVPVRHRSCRVLNGTVRQHPYRELPAGSGS